MLGVCCSCQSAHEVQKSSAPRHELNNMGEDDQDIDHTYGDSINYVMAPHDFCGMPCEGSLDIPQTLIK